jgi:hypothetical protein
MILTQTDAGKTLSIIAANTNKALSEVLKNLNPKELSAAFKETKEFSTLLKNLLKESATSLQAPNKALLELLQNNPSLKNLANATTTLREFEALFAKSDLQMLAQKTPKLKNLQAFLANLTQNNTIEDEKLLQTKLQNSGIFLESKLKNMLTQELSLQKSLPQNDLKALLLQSQAEVLQSDIPQKNEMLKQIDKLLLQIDYYQLLSQATQGSALFLPYTFDMLKEGKLTLKKANNKSFFCDIELVLKEYGELSIRLGLFEKNELSIHMFMQDVKLQELLESNLTQLRKNLFDAGLHLKDISFVKKEKTPSPYKQQLQEDLELGFEVKA